MTDNSQRKNKTKIMKKIILLSALLLAACGTPKTEEVAVESVVDSTKTVVDTCKVDTINSIVTATVVATTTVK